MSAKGKCLVVDDSTTIRRVVAKLLREMEFEVAEAPTGLHAVNHCQEHTPDIIILDWNMPVMDGIACLRALRKLEMPKRPVIIMCTTESQLSKIQEALDAGADEYIMKPFDLSILVDKLAQFNLS